MKERLKELREELSLNQRDFSSRINISQPTLALMENGKRVLRDIHISQICAEFNVNEDWLRHGTGEMFVQSGTFSLDEQAKKSNLTELEIAIMRGYMELDRSTREDIVMKLESIIQQRLETAATIDPIEAELESYRRELEAEKKVRTSLASDEQQGKSG